MGLKETLLEDAKKNGIPKGQVRILSTDPFYVGTEKDLIDAKWVAELWERMMKKRKKPIHLRGFHYWVQSQHIVKPDGFKYAQKDATKDWGYLLHSAQIARYLGIGTWENLIDLKHPNPSDYDNYFVGAGLIQNAFTIEEEVAASVQNFVDSIIDTVVKNSPRFHNDGYQTTHCEVWCEKNSMGFVIEPSCKKFKATYQPLVGQSSVEKVEMSFRRAVKAAEAGKKVRIFYISDNDRYGAAMPIAVARKLEFFARERDLDIKLNMLALTNDQVKEFDLPRAPKLGEMVVELDALEAIYPGELGKIVTSALAPYYDTEKPAIVDKENYRMREAVASIAESKLRPQLEKMVKGIDPKGLGKEIDLSVVIDKKFVPPTPGKEVNENKVFWVYDSDRSFWDQWKVYKDNKVTDVGED